MSAGHIPLDVTHAPSLGEGRLTSQWSVDMPEFPVAFIEDDRGRLIVSQPVTARGLRRPRARLQPAQQIEIVESEAAIAALAGPYTAAQNDPIRLARAIVSHFLRTGWCVSSINVKDAMVAIGVLYKPGSDVEMHVRGESAFFATLRTSFSKNNPAN